MALLKIPQENRVVTDEAELNALLAEAGIEHERWATRPLPGHAASEDVLAAFAPEIAALKARGGYVTADVIDVVPQTPGLDAMLARFSREHWHDEDEVRFILEGRGLFHVRPRSGRVLAIEVEPGDLLRVPRGTWHWFDLCADRRIRAIRLFQDPSGWTPQYTDSGADRGFEPVCLGQRELPAPA